jgi:hypothetical protein
MLLWRKIFGDSRHHTGTIARLTDVPGQHFDYVASNGHSTEMVAAPSAPDGQADIEIVRARENRTVQSASPNIALDSHVTISPGGPNLIS